VRAVDASQALAELTAISTQIEAAAIVDEQQSVVGSIHADGEALAFTARLLLERAAQSQGREPTQIGVSTPQGGVFVLREGAHTIVATTTPDPISTLVFYDLKMCVRSLDPPAKPKRRRAKASSAS
jgi:hypothetical protein